MIIALESKLSKMENNVRLLKVLIKVKMGPFLTLNGVNMAT